MTKALRSITAASIAAVLAISAGPGLLSYAPALACNPGRTPGSATAGFSGTQRTTSTTPVGVQTRIERYYPYLHNGAMSLAWNMLTRPKAANGDLYWAQIGWATHVEGGWTYIDIFTSWTDNAGNFWLDFHNGAQIQATYYTYFIPATKKFTLAAGSTNWKTGVTGGWTPTNAQIYGETHNYNTQMPGDTGNKVLMDNAKYLLNGQSTWLSMNSAAGANKSWYGATKNSATSYSIWDKACSSDGP